MQEIKIKVKSLQNKQREVFDAIMNTPASVTKYHVLRASRQSGKTHLGERTGLVLGAQESKQSGAIVMATERQTRKVFDSMMGWIDRSLIANSWNSNGNRRIRLVNDTDIDFYSANSYDTIAGNSHDFLIGDEMALWNPYAWSIIRPTLAAKPNAKVLLFSTTRGKNDFYKMCMEGMNISGTFVQHYRMSYLDNKYYDLREIAEARKTMPDAIFRQEYLAEFIEGVSQVFGDFSHCQNVTKYKGYTEGLRHYFGIDISGAGNDKTILTIINELGEVVFIYEVQAITHTDQAREINVILKDFPGIVGYGEKNGLGDSLCDLLIQSKCKLQKWITTNDSKQELIAGMLEDIADLKIQLPSGDLCEPLENEMENYICVRTSTGKIAYSHPAGLHDDYIDSLMLANRARHDMRSQKTAVRQHFTGIRQNTRTFKYRM